MKLSFRTTMLDILVGHSLRLHRSRCFVFGLPMIAAFFTCLIIQDQPPVTNLPGALLTTFVLILIFWAVSSGIVLVTNCCALLLAERKGVIGFHELSLEDDGLLEVTEVNRSLASFSVVGLAYKRFGLWIIPVGPGVFFFRESRISSGDIDVFADELNRRVKA